MTIDERIEALTQSVELLSRMHQDNERRYELLFERQGHLLERLVNIAENHESPSGV
jgi:hypothetical protein